MGPLRYMSISILFIFPHTLHPHTQNSKIQKKRERVRARYMAVLAGEEGKSTAGSGQAGRPWLGVLQTERLTGAMATRRRSFDL